MSLLSRRGPLLIGFDVVHTSPACLTRLHRRGYMRKVARAPIFFSLLFFSCVSPAQHR